MTPTIAAVVEDDTPVRLAPPRFVVQRHRAEGVHYDLRLEVDGVLASWRVPRGPTLDAGVRRLATHVEDHPLHDADFEGVVPRGEQGAGDVIVWDRGTYRSLSGDPSTAIRDGELQVELHGEKLRGRFVLLRTGRSKSEGRQWLLRKSDDGAAVEGWDAEHHPRSVLSGRTNDQVLHPPAPPPLRPDPHDRWHGASAAQLEALEQLGSDGTWHVDGVDVVLSNLDKVLFPGRGSGGPVTKRDLIRYYATLAPTLLPYLEGRPVNLQRFPDGVERKGFWQKSVPSNAPEWLTRWQDRHARPGRTEWYSVIDRPAALVWMANLAVVELHPWTSPADRPHEPSWALIDIDPGPSTTFDDVVVLARLYRTALEHLDVLGGPKVTGQRGVQIWVPVGPGHSYERTRGWVEALSRMVASLVPELVSWEWRTQDRGGLARLDFTQNALHKTLVAPWSLRPAAGAPVSVPIGWAELEDPELVGDRWSIGDVPARLRSHGDPLAPLIGLAQDLPPL